MAIDSVIGLTIKNVRAMTKAVEHILGETEQPKDSESVECPL